ncbi:hypothetical protein CEY16_12335 [Halalkalibacillus sediminis]|uniref:Uncharacterized protein n=1 Tax=Halalkalibacillus sediminis TaxID=2018042 RepID=A0A2I0QT45_9BACI|nr:polysaccharide biosynthesis protein [Halalkalibacillus sediminis]PKR77507.1 hypothetical protein CEY16_12335 [Halalkalibacillus sediminis]
MSGQAMWVKGTLLLSIAGLLSKVLGMVYRIPLQNLAGDEGLYIYQQIYPILSLAIILSLYSIPSAISQVIADNKRPNASIRIKDVLVVFYLLFAGGAAVFILLYALAPWLAGLMGDPQLTQPIRVSSAIFLVIPFTAFLRGYFQIEDQYSVMASSQVVEQLFRVAGIIIFTVIITGAGLSLYQVGTLAAWSTIGGTVVGASFLFIAYRFYIKSQSSRSEKVSISPSNLTRGLLVGLSIYSLTYVLHLLVQVIDVFTMIDLLKDWGASTQASKVWKGVYDRGNPLIQLGLVFGSSIALSLIPSLRKSDADISSGSTDDEKFALKFTFLFSTAATAGLIAIMPMVNPLFYKSSDGTFAIQLMMPAVFLLSLVITFSVILQRYGVKLQQLIWVVVMLVIKGIGNTLLIPLYGITGASIATLIALAFLTLVMYYHYQRLTKSLVKYTFLVNTLLVTAFMGLLISLITHWVLDLIDIQNRLIYIPVVALTCTIGAAIFIYSTYKFKLLSNKELQLITTYLKAKKGTDD